MPSLRPYRVRVEVCVNSPDRERTRRAVSAAYEGGAARVELCAGMDVGGLTPPPDHISVAREAFQDRPGLIVMIRPRASDFVYTPYELSTMAAQIRDAHDAGADGVALGVLRRDGSVDMDAMRRLVDVARSCGLATTFHRAFDAAADPLTALDDLLHLGVDRVLTAGIPWGVQGTALDGVHLLREVVSRAASRLEVVAGGGVSVRNVAQLLDALPLAQGSVSVHAYSGAQQAGDTTSEAVHALVQTANAPEVAGERLQE